MKHIWFIDEKEFDLKDGYIVQDKIPDPIMCKTVAIFDNESCDNLIYSTYTEKVFPNKEIAVTILNEMILIQIKKLEKYIKDCQDKVNILADKLRMDNIVQKNND